MHLDLPPALTGLRELAPGGRQRLIARVLTQVIEEGSKPGASRPSNYLDIEAQLIAIGGPEMSRIHSGRSRQDMLAAYRQVVMREELLRTFGDLNDLREYLLNLAETHANAIFPAYTWGVQAQPITFGQYLLAFSEELERVAQQLTEAYARVNLSPLGVAVTGTNSFPIDRNRLAELLGFDGLLENGFGANQLSPIRLGVEVVGIAEAAALVIAVLVEDIQVQYHQSRPWLRPVVAGGSSIMPQKLNPTGLNNLRHRIGVLLADAWQFKLHAHNVSAGLHDYKGQEPADVLRALGAVLRETRSELSNWVLDVERAYEEVAQDYSAASELANVLQRVGNVPFRVAHHFASELVAFGRAHGLVPMQLPYSEARRLFSEIVSTEGYSMEFPLSEEEFRTALSPEHMVASSQVIGGPQPAEVSRMLARQRDQLQADREWVRSRWERLEQASTLLNATFERFRDGI